MAEYVLEKTDSLNMDHYLSNNPNIKDVFMMDGLEDSDNIALLNARCRFLYQRILELESRLKAVERRR